MATKPKGKASKSSFRDDLLDSLLDDDKQPVRTKASRDGPMYSTLAQEIKMDGADTEDSDVSVADPSDILKSMKDMDDMDADLFASKKKPSSAPAQTKPLVSEGPKKDSAVLESNAKPEGADEPTKGGKKPNSVPLSSARSYKKFTFSDSGGEDEGVAQTPYAEDLDDPLNDLLPGDSKPDLKSSFSKPEKSVPSPSASPMLKNETTKATKKGELTFEDDKDHLMDALGFDSDKNNPKKKETPLWSPKERADAPQRPRTRIDEILESFTSPRLLERPPTGERKDELQSQEKPQQEKTSAGKEPHLDDDLTFGSYQPTLGSTSEGRQSRRQSVRFSAEDMSVSTPEKKPKPTTPTSSRQRNSADWLGLKTEDEPVYLEEGVDKTKNPAEASKSPSSPLLERKTSFTGSHSTSVAKTPEESSAPADNTIKHAKPEVSKTQRKEGDDEDDWLAGALSRRKALSTLNIEAKTSKQEESFTDFSVSKQVTSQTPKSREDTLPSIKETSDTFPGRLGPAAHSTPVREERLNHVPQQNATLNTSAAFPQQASFSADSLQQLLLQNQLMQTQLLGLGGVVDAGLLQRLKEKEQPADYQALQARVIQLEGQVKTLQLERDQSQMMLESMQQRHKQDMELLENAHKARVKLLEDSVAQREIQARHECEDLMERLATVTRAAEKERSELQAQYQRKMAQAQQERDCEVERLRDLQRKSILEMKRDYEDQIHRLKRLKEEEIDAVTSATSQTRSVAGVIEKMEQFSSRLGELSSRVESTHEHTAHGLEQEARHRDQQLRTMQGHLAQQQKAMAEEKAYLKDIISRMDTQLKEQQRQLEKERWKMTAEQAKAESTQRSLEEERRVLTTQISVEREELERAKSALLEEQKSVMQHCADERRKLAAEWALFHAQEKQRHERAEREVSSLLENREGSIISLAQEQADLKLRTAELKQKELAVAREREALEELREELDREKERLSSTALRLKTRAQEVEAFSKLAAEKYEEGERAFQEAKRLEAEHNARLRNIHSQTEHLRQQEQRILKEQIRLSHLQKDTERLRQNPPLTPLPQIIAPVLPDSVSELPATLNVPPPVSFTSSQSMALQANLALWRYTAEKDREYLQEEQYFLENLKKKSYRSSFSTD
ncbi:fas-binding factor 1 homolog isoform X1 [Oreochromis niloticus]|uniref:fas-binding factor 1 homolog isoform X1 n=1 Tax=Oreochromis niloticus TaxID=8128 RepID=UPI00025FC9FC|nr:fas-binding factor 1 isoform X1 [Oreochromis niloticus]XP_025762645.1 fas-binding factor 1 isoform X1 [Oreochromis niloticus]XP_025762646.1 fas-binding factor 1 isoform X1 [Oreochromis niloticus]